jgi:hypothetical protein
MASPVRYLGLARTRQRIIRGEEIQPQRWGRWRPWGARYVLPGRWAGQAKFGHPGRSLPPGNFQNMSGEAGIWVLKGLDGFGGRRSNPSRSGAEAGTSPISARMARSHARTSSTTRRVIATCARPEKR